MEYCAICDKPNAEIHHLVFGTASRKLADADGLVLPVCREHHEFLHQNAKVSKMVGQLIYERNKCAEGYSIDGARDSFRLRYGRSYL